VLIKDEGDLYYFSQTETQECVRGLGKNKFREKPAEFISSEKVGFLLFSQLTIKVDQMNPFYFLGTTF
jgi:YHS domain-containing protein